MTRLLEKVVTSQSTNQFMSKIINQIENNIKNFKSTDEIGQLENTDVVNCVRLELKRAMLRVVSCTRVILLNLLRLYKLEWYEEWYEDSSYHSFVIELDKLQQAADRIKIITEIKDTINKKLQRVLGNNFVNLVDISYSNLSNSYGIKSMSIYLELNQDMHLDSWNDSRLLSNYQFSTIIQLVERFNHLFEVLQHQYPDISVVQKFQCPHKNNSNVFKSTCIVQYYGTTANVCFELVINDESYRHVYMLVYNVNSSNNLKKRHYCLWSLDRLVNFVGRKLSHAR